MEEILASIRRIISEDGEEEEKPQAARANGAAERAPATDGAPAAAGDEVLELTEEVDADGNVVVAQAPAPAAPVVEVSVPAPEPAPEPGAQPAAQPSSAPEAPDSAPPLMESIAEDAAAGAFAALASRVGQQTTESDSQKILPAGRTIEDHVLEMLRPMLREWLDKHLPQMVQRLVQREIDRIIQRSDPA